MRTLRQARQQLSGFLLRHRCHYHRPAWTQLHRRWLASLKFDQAVHHIVLEDCIAAVEAAMARRDRLEAHIEAVLPEWSLAPVVEALQALRGVRLVAAATLVAELGDITRFTNPRQLMAYLGLVPSEHSSGRTRRQGGITKAGNGAARRMLIEAAWSYRFPARISREQLLRQERLAKPICDIAWKAQERLCRRYRKLARAGKLPTVITAAIARELAGFIWAIAKQVQPSGYLNEYGLVSETVSRKAHTTQQRIQCWARPEARSRPGEPSRVLSAGSHPTLDTRPRKLRDVSPVRR